MKKLHALHKRYSTRSIIKYIFLLLLNLLNGTSGSSKVIKGNASTPKIFVSQIMHINVFWFTLEGIWDL